MEEKKRPAWEQRDGESNPAYAAFCVYKDMGHERTVAAVVRKIGKSRSLLDRWKIKHEWDARCRAYDAELEHAEIARKKKLISDTKDRQLKISYSLEKKALEALNLLQPEDMTPKDIKELLRLAIEIQARNLIDEPVVETQKESTLAESIISAYEKRRESGEL